MNRSTSLPRQLARDAVWVLLIALVVVLALAVAWAAYTVWGIASS